MKTAHSHRPNEEALRLAFTAMIAMLFLDAHCQFGPQRLIRQSYFDSSSEPRLFDLDNDGDLDALLTNGVIMENGGPPFSLAPIGTDGLGCGMAYDIDADGLLDDVCLTGGSWTIMTWRRNLGNLTFGPPQTITGQSPSILDAQLADLNDDGNLDLIYAESSSGYRRQINLGGGDFGTPFPLASLPSSNARLHLADVDGDERLDIIHCLVTGASTSTRRVLHNTGNFTFVETMSYNHTIASTSMNYVLSGDVNADGRMDIIEISSGLTYTYRQGLSDGTISPALPLTTFESHPSRFVFYDVNGDGQRDLIANTQSLQTILSVSGATTGSPIEVLPAGFTDLFNSSSWIGVFDYDSDGTIELIVRYQDNLVAFRSNGTGGVNYVAHLLDYVRATYPQIEAADFDGDGLADIICSQFSLPQIGLYKGTNGLAWPAVQLISSYDSGSDRPFDIADMDADGDPDIVVIDQGHLVLLRNVGSFLFVSTTLVSMNGFSVKGLHCHDMDGDGDLDILATGLNRHRIVRNNSGDSFVVLADQTPLSFTCCEKITLIEDFDEDGDPDILVDSDPTVRWIRNNGGLNFGPRAFLPNSFQPYKPQFVDLDGDGKKDLISRSGSLTWMRHVSGLTYDPQITAFAPAVAGRTEVFDYDNDGDLDFIGVGIGSSGGTVALNNGNGQFTELGPLTSQPWGIISTTAENMTLAHDMDGDSDTDILYLAPPNSPFGNRLCWAENLAVAPYQISGFVFADMDGNGTFGPPDFGLPASAITSSPAGYVVGTGQSGGYLLYGGLGNHTVSAAMTNTGGFWSPLPAPPSYSVSLSEAVPAVSGVDFAFQPLVDTTSIVPSMVPSPGPCGGITSLWLNLFNEGTQVAQGTLTLTLDASYAFITSEPVPSSVTGNVITWDFESLVPFDFMVFHLSVQQPSVANLGQPWTHTLVAEASDSFGGSIGTFSETLQGIVACSYDPNDKLVAPVGYGIHGAIPISTNHLQYTIRFQNTGNAPAYDVMLRDELPAGIVPGSLFVAGYSHPPTAVFINPSGELVVQFEGIQLTAATDDFIASQGFISVRFLLEEGLPHLFTLGNTAEIYFDLNPPIFTNIARSTLVDCSLWQPMITVPEEGVLQVPAGDAYQWLLDGDELTNENGQQLEIQGLGDYSAQVTSVYGCTSVTPDFQVLALSDHAGPSHGCTLHPNPMTVSTVLSNFMPFAEGDRLVIVDGQGRIVRNIILSGMRSVLIRRNDLAAGLYILTVHSQDHAPFATRLMIE